MINDQQWTNCNILEHFESYIEVHEQSVEMQKRWTLMINAWFYDG